MSTRSMPSPAGGNGEPSTVEVTTNSSGATPSQPTRASMPSASASSALARRRMVAADTRTSRDKLAHVIPRAARSTSIIRHRRARSNRSITGWPSRSSRSVFPGTMGDRTGPTPGASDHQGVAAHSITWCSAPIRIFPGRRWTPITCPRPGVPLSSPFLIGERDIPPTGGR